MRRLVVLVMLLLSLTPTTALMDEMDDDDSDYGDLGYVGYVADSDTLRVVNARGDTYKMRLMLIDGPERSRPGLC